MQRKTLTEIKRQLQDTPNDLAVFAELLLCLDEMRSADLNTQDVVSLKDYKEQLLASINRLTDERALKMLDKVFDESKTDKKRIDDQASGLTAVFWSGTPTYQRGRLKKVYETFKPMSNLQKEKFFQAIKEGNLKAIESFPPSLSLKLNIDDGSALMAAATNGQPEIVKWLIKDKNSNINKEYNGCTPLYAAAESGHLAVVQILLSEKDIKVDPVSNAKKTPLVIAAEKRHIAVVSALVEKGADVNWKPSYDDATLLFRAAASNDIDLMRVLLAAKTIDVWLGCRGYKESPLFKAIISQHPAAVKVLLDYGVSLWNGYYGMPLETAIDYGDWDSYFLVRDATLTWLLQQELDKISDYQIEQLSRFTTSLFVAFRDLPEEKKLVVAKEIFDETKPDKKNLTTVIGKVFCHNDSEFSKIYQECKKLGLFQTDESRKTDSFFQAIEGGDLGQVEQCLAIPDFNLNVFNTNDLTPLMCAAYCGRLNIVKAFLTKKVDVSQALENGATALYIAAQNGHEDVVKLLLENGAIVNQTSDGVTPLEIASERNHTEIVNCLLDATLTWLQQAQVADVTEEMAKKLKPYKKQLFESIKKLPDEDQKKQIILKIFDNSADDRKNHTTALGKVFCQGNSSIHKSKSQLGSIFDECVNLKWVTRPEGSVFLMALSLFKRADKKIEEDAPDIDADAASSVFNHYDDAKL